MCPYLCGQPGPPSFHAGLRLFAAQAHQRGGKVGLGSVSHDYRAAKALFSLLCRLKSTLRTCHAAGRLQTNVFCSSLGVWEVRCPKKALLHLPQPARSSLQRGRAPGSSQRWERLSPQPRTPGTSPALCKGRSRSLNFMVRAIIHFSAGVRRAGGHRCPVQGQGRDAWRAFGCARGTNEPRSERPGCCHSRGDLPAERFAGRSPGEAPSPRPHHGLASGQGTAKPS